MHDDDALRLPPVAPASDAPVAGSPRHEQRRRFTDAWIGRLRPAPEGRRLHYLDSERPGLILRVTDKGAKTFVVNRRLPGGKKTIRHKLGRYPDIPLALARKLAADSIASFAIGIDPREAARQKAAEQETKAERSFGFVAGEFLERSAKGKRSYYETRRILRAELLPRLADVPLASITRADISALLARIVDRGSPGVANWTLSVVSRIYAYALDRGLVESHPTARMRAPGKHQSRSRVYTDLEMLAIWRAFDKAGWPFGTAGKLLATTAARRGAVAGMRWSELDLEAGTWTIPAARSKIGEVLIMPLSPLSLAVIAGVPRLGDCLFSIEGDRPVVGFSGARARIVRQPGVPGDFRFHDLRRSARTGLSMLGVAGDIAELCLGHTLPGQMRRTYDRWSYLPQKREALDRWSRHLAKIVGIES